jgi:hypothetical protein
MTPPVLLPDGVKGDGEHEAAGEDAQPGLLPVAVHAYQLRLHVPAHRRRRSGIFTKTGGFLLQDIQRFLTDNLADFFV